MSDPLFISYSSVDGEEFSLRLADDLAGGPPPVPVWVDKRQIRPVDDWDEQIDEAIKNCKGMLFVITHDSSRRGSVCKNEWVQALRYKKPIIPLLVHRDAKLPLRLASREYIDFTGSYETALASLRSDFYWMDSPAGQLQSLKYRLADAERELPRVAEERQPLIKEDIAELERQIAQQQAIVDDPSAAQQRVQQSIERGLERARKPAEPAGGVSHSKFINPPPLVAPTWFQDRHIETQLIGDFLKDDALRLMIVVGRGGIGKSAMVCRLLRSLERGELPDGSPLAVGGIVYLSDARQFHRVTVPDLYDGLSKLLPEETVSRLDSVYKNAQATTAETMQALVDCFRSGRTVVLLDNFEDEVDIETGQIKNAELDEALNALLELPPHGLKVIITTRVAPRDLAQVEPVLQRRLNLDTGLEQPFAENILRAMDADGKVGLRNAPEALLADARERTRGYPRALEHLFGILSADRDTSLQEILEDTERLLPEKVVAVLVGEAFNRLDLTAQRVMQALATYRYPVPSAAVDYLLQAYVPGVDSAPVLSRLVNMQFVRREEGRYYLHQIDHDYAVGRTPEGERADREAESPPLTRFALRHRAAEWFKLSRKPQETWKALEDLAPQLSEFELRCAGEDYDTAARVLLAIDFNFLMVWGHYRLAAQLHERLQGTINDPQLRQASVGNLGAAYDYMHQYRKAIACYEEALRQARERKDRRSEALALCGLGNSYYGLGQTEKGTKYHKQALAISREVGDRDSEASILGNLGNSSSDLGQTVQAIEYYECALAIIAEVKDRSKHALLLSNLAVQYANLGQTDRALQIYSDAGTIAQDIGYRLAMASGQAGIGDIYLARGEWKKAANQFKQAIEIADETGDTQIQQWARLTLALTFVYGNDLAGAREMAEAAGQYDSPLGNDRASAVVGLVTLLQGDRSSAQAAFARALGQAGEPTAQTAQRYGVLDTKGLALSGLALCENPKEHIPAARQAYSAARAINSDPGVVCSVLQLFDALARADTNGLLAEVRPQAAGEQSR